MNKKISFGEDRNEEKAQRNEWNIACVVEKFDRGPQHLNVRFYASFETSDYI